MIRRDRRLFLRLCPWCDREAGRCWHPDRLLAQARARLPELLRPTRTAWRPYPGPWIESRAPLVGLAWPASSRGPVFPVRRRVARPAPFRKRGLAAS